MIPMPHKFLHFNSCAQINWTNCNHDKQYNTYYELEKYFWCAENYDYIMLNANPVDIIQNPQGNSDNARKVSDNFEIK